MQSKATTIEAYLQSLPQERREVVAALDALVRKEAPGVRATMKYGMPTYEMDHHGVAVNAQKNYFSLYIDPQIVALHREALAHLDCGKSCIRFKKLSDLPLPTVREMLRRSAGK